MSTPLSAQYQLVILPEHPTEQDLRALVEPYQALIATQFLAILERTEHSSTYPWIDTKINLNTGQDYPADDPLYGRNLVSGWVQGRGLEALVGFADWLAPFAGDPQVDGVLARVRRLVAALFTRMSEARALNHGHLYFFMTPEGRAFRFGPAGEQEFVTFDAETPHNFSDLFSAKGMYAAAHYLGDVTAFEQARAFCQSVYKSIRCRTFASDQPQPPQLAKAWVPGAFSHGPSMIAQGMAALMVQCEPGLKSAEIGLSLARYVLDAHINLAGRWPELQELDLVEYIDAQGRPYMEDGKIASDPGHSVEYAGLFLKLSAAARRSGGLAETQQREFAEFERWMPAYMMHNFANGFRTETGGIGKTIDLLTRRPMDATLPWWSLPETVRAALGCWRVSTDAAGRQACLDILARSHNAFVQHYVRPDIHLMAVKLRGANGEVLDILPNYPDADPGYHTALSLIDALQIIAGRW